jgi:hypothetical protein
MGNLCCAREHSVQFFVQFFYTVKLHSLTQSVTLTDESNLQKIWSRFVFCPNRKFITVCLAMRYPAIRPVSLRSTIHLNVILPAVTSSVDIVTELGAQ